MLQNISSGQPATTATQKISDTATSVNFCCRRHFMARACSAGMKRGIEKFSTKKTLRHAPPKGFLLSIETVLCTFIFYGRITPSKAPSLFASVFSIELKSKYSLALLKTEGVSTVTFNLRPLLANQKLS